MHQIREGTESAVADRAESRVDWAESTKSGTEGAAANHIKEENQEDTWGKGRAEFVGLHCIKGL